MLTGLTLALLIPTATLGLAAMAKAQDPSARNLAFFEEKVRPLLALRCHKCHGPNKQKSDLRLDHIRHMRKGGERGPALDAANPAHSRILHAISYADSELQMPPKKRLAADEIDVLRRWITVGAPWPDEPLPTSKPKKVFDLHKRRAAHWAWRKLHDGAPPAVDDPEWRENPIDRFVLTKLREKGLPPAPPADKRTLLRRVTFDLTGLPPTVAELNAFLSDKSPGAYHKVIGRLIASPHYGEHWARHWLDLVRFAETMGHEFDYEIPNAWRYRDYVIRAFNLDVPYDEFVREHIAGDLIESPRRNQQAGFNESLIGTGYHWFVEQVHSPVDVRKHTADRTHNQIDVLSKTFLGLTVGCARCHDHKFDAISHADYYALSGFMKSSRYMQRDAGPAIDREAQRAYRTSSKALTAAWAAQIRAAASDVKPYFLSSAAKRLSVACEDITGLDEETAKRWKKALEDKQINRDILHPMHGLSYLGKVKNGKGDVRQAWLRATERARKGPSEFAKSNPETFVDFRKDYFTKWFKEGVAFGAGPVRGPAMVHGDWLPTAIHAAGWASSNANGLRAQGVLHSPQFKIVKRYVHVLAHGREGRINFILEGFYLNKNPIYGGLRQGVNSTTPRWYTFDLNMWKGKRTHLVFCDQTVHDLAGGGNRQDGYLSVQRVAFADTRNPPNPHAHMAETVFGTDGDPVRSLSQVIDSYCAAFLRAADALETNSVTAEQARLLNWMWEKKLFGEDGTIAELRKKVVESSRRVVAGSMLVLAIADGNGEDENIFVRGEHNTLGSVTPRRLLTAIAGEDQPRLGDEGSGRLVLANAVVAPSNPFSTRVAVNRLWHHLFGRGLVATVDNLGVQGKPPSHPLLLDWLARQFVRDGWSFKKSIRRMVLSRTYRMSSKFSPEVDKKDPEIQWLHRMRVRRLPGESIRDSVLQTSGRLDRKMFGPSIPVNLTKFMSGRGRPRGGPLDGAGRRSVYLRISRNFLSPFLLAFDFPLPTSTMGRRGVTNVPAQALALLNDTFVLSQAKIWAKRIAKAGDAPKERIRTMYRIAFTREVRPEEETRMLDFLHKQALVYRCGLDDERVWQDLCHAMWNVKEFIFIR
jgi:hypothetical protein